MNKTLFEKIWEQHLVVDGGNNEQSLIYIDLQLLHEVTSPQAFESLKLNNRTVARPELNVATVDHSVPTTATRTQFIADEIARKQIATLRDNVKRHNIRFFDVGSKGQGIVHVLGPEQGFTLPGMTIVCGDSHTSTHGAFGTLSFGIGTSEIEHVLTTQTLLQKKPKTLRINYSGKLPNCVTAKDLILHTIRTINVDGGTGCAIEYAGETIKTLNMEGRMTVCNMSIEGGARAGLIEPDEKTFEWLKGRPFAPKGVEWDKAKQYWLTLTSDKNAKFDKEIDILASEIEPSVSWGTNPAQVVGISEKVPSPKDFEDKADSMAAEKALDYMNLKPGTPIQEIKLERVFIGSCTNARLKDLREAAKMVSGKKVASNILAMVVPGSTLTKYLAEKEGLDEVFKSAGFDWREAGCSMCLGMNEDILTPGERCASTSNRNFEGRQGRGGRTHLVSPAMAAAAAIYGKFVDIRKLN